MSREREHIYTNMNKITYINGSMHMAHSILNMKKQSVSNLHLKTTYRIFRKIN